MIIAIDPDVLVASLTDSHCAYMIHQIDENLEQLRIVVDDQGKILAEYGNFLLSHLEEKGEHLVISLLEKILFDKEEIILPLPTQMSLFRKELLERHKCTTPVEPELIAMCANAKHLELRLLLAGTGINARLRHRGLNDPQARRALKKEIPWLDVRFASDRGEPFKTVDLIDYHARIFELQAAIHLQTHHPNLRCVETPSDVKKKLQEREGKTGGDIDLYGYEEFEDKLVVWVGECKLRKESKKKSKKKSKGIKTKEINQLHRKMEAARDYETKRDDFAGTLVQRSRKEVKIRGLMISNAEDFYDDLTRQEAKKLEIEFWQAKLLRGWTTNVHWHITELTIQK